MELHKGLLTAIEKKPKNFAIVVCPLPSASAEHKNAFIFLSEELDRLTKKFTSSSLCYNSQHQLSKAMSNGNSYQYFDSTLFESDGIHLNRNGAKMFALGLAKVCVSIPRQALGQPKCRVKDLHRAFKHQKALREMSEKKTESDSSPKV